MASTIEELQHDIEEAVSSGYRGRLLDRGQARAMIWKDGVLPPNAPVFSTTLSYDLLSYGYSLLDMGMRLHELEGNPEICRVAFEKAASSIQNVVEKGNPNDSASGFHNVLAASAYHLAGYSAKAYSLINKNIQEEKISPIEKALCFLMLRKFNELEANIWEWELSGTASDRNLADTLDHELDSLSNEIDGNTQLEEFGLESVELPVVDLAITDKYYSALSLFLMAYELGEKEFIDQSRGLLQTNLSICRELNLVPHWWIHKITIHLLGGLWSSSFHEILPIELPNEDSADWVSLRWYFIALLYKREKSEVDLWPSQVEGAKRAIDQGDNLVVSLPTSSGKTRIAELCILRCLASRKRVLFITPLRALSAQTEIGLRKTFLPLGKTVSTLYGSMGTSDFEQDALRTKNIVVGTPEKLDFALRNDPTLIDDVGLIVLDEGHMIGLNEREIRYEVQIQRLLRRPDAKARRIVCLSAILPEGDQLEDFVKWLRMDKEGESVTSEWRPTDLRFGEIIWNGQNGRLNIHVGDEGSFVPNFIESMIPSVPNPGIRKTPFPRDAKELNLATAWRLIDDGHTVLIYCPQKSSVEGFAKTIVELNGRGALPSVLTMPEEKLYLARTLGREWLGENHPVLECLSLGVAIHHGSLPSPFRKEIEKLLREGVLKITVSSPTLAQGLNLAATAVIFQSLYRSGKLIESSEFKNVIGRAGRAFVDVQGLVIHPMIDRHDWRAEVWNGLINDTKLRNMESGLLRLVGSLLSRMAASIGSNSIDDIVEYIANNAQHWPFPEVENELVENRERELNQWMGYIDSLDTAILSLLGEEQINEENIAEILDQVLTSSLWQRRLNRQPEAMQDVLNKGLVSRSKYIWSNSTSAQRKGYFLAGVGLETGQRLDAIANEANSLLINANEHILNENDQAIATIVELAGLLFQIKPFTPDPFLENWEEILGYWLRGEPIVQNNIGDISEVMNFVEDALVYKLPWAMEAVRVRAEANQDDIFEGITIDSFETGLVVPAVENGTLNRSAALLMQAGFNSRQAAIKAVTDCAAIFTTASTLNEWLESETVNLLTQTDVWPTPETASMWESFINESRLSNTTVWGSLSATIPVNWYEHITRPVPAQKLRLINNNEHSTFVITADGEIVGQTPQRINLLNNGIYYSTVNDNGNDLSVVYIGAGDTPFYLQAVV